MMPRGETDLRNLADAHAARLPEPLRPLAHIACNYRWSWLPGGPELFEDLAPHRWQACGNSPIRLLQEVSVAALEHACQDEAYLGRVHEAQRAIEEDLARPPLDGPASPERPVAFFCS